MVDAGVKELFPPFLLQHVGVPDGTDGTQRRRIGNSEYGRKWTWWRCLQTIFERTYFNSRINDTVDTCFSTLKNFDYCNFLYMSIPRNKSHTTRFRSLSLSSRQGRQKIGDCHGSRLEDLTPGLDFLVRMIYQTCEHIDFSYLGIAMLTNFKLKHKT